MLGNVSRFVVCASAAILLASCSSTGTGNSGYFSSGIGGLGNGQNGAGKSDPSSHITPMISSSGDAGQPAGTAKTASGTTQRVVQGACPQIFMKDAEAIYRVYAKGGKKDDPQQVSLQASIGNYTRQCTTDDQNLTMTVVAQLRLVAGPMGYSGSVNLPIRITVEDETSTYYSEVTNFAAELPPGQGSAQVLFRKDGIKLPLGSGALVRVNVGFDQGAPAKTKTKKKK